MQNKDVDRHLGKTGIFFRKKKTNEVIFKATERLTEKLMDLIKNKFISEKEDPDEIHKTHIPDEVLKEIKDYLQLHFTTLITDLLKKDFPGVFQSNQSDPSVKLRAGTPNHEDFKLPEVYSVAVQKSPEFSSEETRNNFYLMLNYYIENVFMAPLFIITLASRAQQSAISITAKTIREYRDDVKRLIRYENIIERPTNPREEFVRDMFVAIDKLKKMPGKLTITKISKEFTPKRTTFYGMLEKHRLEINKDFEIIDKKTDKPFEFS